MSGRNKKKIITPKMRQIDSDDKDQLEAKKETKKESNKKKIDSKEITFIYLNPKNNKTESRKMTIHDNTLIPDIIQDFNDFLGVNNIIGIKKGRTDYLKDNNIEFSASALYFEENLDNLEINFIIDPSSKQKTNSNNAKNKKDIIFKYLNPNTNRVEKKPFTINDSTKISHIVQNFNEFLGVNNIIGFKKNLVEFRIANDMRLADTSLYSDENLDNCEISFIFDPISKQTTARTEIKNQKQKIKLYYFNEVDEVDYDFSSPKSTVTKVENSFIKSKNIVIVLYFQGGNMKNMSINDFNKNGSFQNYLYAIAANKSSFDCQQANDQINISKKSITSLFPELNSSNYNSYVCLICCILKYIQLNFYKSLHIIKSFFETVNFVPFLTSLYSVYDNNITKLSIFTIVSFLLFYAPTFDQLKSLFSTMSSYNCKRNLRIFMKCQNPDHTFKHDAKGPPQVIETDCFNPNENPWKPIFIAKANDLRSRNYWSIIKYKEGCILGMLSPDDKNPSEPSNILSYYDPNLDDTLYSMPINYLDDYEKNLPMEKDKSAEKFIKASFNVKYSQATTAIIDYSGSMIACFDEKSERRSKIAVNIINQFIQAGNDMSVNDPFTLLNKNLSGETRYPLEYNAKDFVNPSRVYDRIERAANYMTTENYTKKLKENAIKRILLVSDGQDGKSEKTKYDILKLLLEKHIILDVILLKDDGNSAKDLCALSHISGGNYYRPYSKDDAYFIARYADLVKKTEDKPFVHLKSYKFISNTEFDNISDNMRIKDKINIIKASIQKDFYENHSLYSVFSTLPNPIKEDFQGYRIQKEIDICADYIRSQKNNGKEPFFMIYREFYVDSAQIRHDRVMVFLKGAKRSTIKVIHQALITFTYYYPFEMPRIELLSRAELENPLPNGIFKLKSESYRPEMRLIYILFKLNEALVCKEKPIEKNDDLDPISSLDQIRSVFRYYEIPNDKEIKSYSKYFNFI